MVSDQQKTEAPLFCRSVGRLFDMQHKSTVLTSQQSTVQWLWQQVVVVENYHLRRCWRQLCVRWHRHQHHRCTLLVSHALNLDVTALLLFRHVASPLTSPLHSSIRRIVINNVAQCPSIAVNMATLRSTRDHIRCQPLSGQLEARKLTQHDGSSFQTVWIVRRCDGWAECEGAVGYFDGGGF